MVIMPDDKNFENKSSQPWIFLRKSQSFSETNFRHSERVFTKSANFRALDILKYVLHKILEISSGGYLERPRFQAEKWEKNDDKSSLNFDKHKCQKY